MIKVSNKFYSFLALIFMVLTVFGYQLATSLFLPLSSDVSTISRTVTYPYRGVMLILSILLIVASPQAIKVVEDRKAANLLMAFFVIYFLRIMIDIFLRNVNIDPNWRQTTIQFIFLSVLPSLLAIMRCAQYIDYNRLNKWFLWCGAAMLTILVMNQSSLIQAEYDEMSRLDANVAMNSISLGHMACTIFFVALAWIISHKHKFLIKGLLIAMMLVSFVIMLRAASRGPLMAFLVMLLLVVFSSVKNKVLAILLSVLALLLVWVNMNSLLHFIGEISPMMEQRMSTAAYEGDSSGRDTLYANAMDVFLRNPIVGDQFVLDIGFYSHNSVLDVLMALGVFGGLVWIYLMIKDVVITSRHLLSRSSLMIVGLISIQMIVMHMFSGAIYASNETIVLMATVLLMQKPETANGKTIN